MAVDGIGPSAPGMKKPDLETRPGLGLLLLQARLNGSGYVLGPVLAHHLLHLIFQVEL